MDDTRLVSVAEAADRLGMSKWQVYRRIERGDIKAELKNKPTARYMIPESELTSPKPDLSPPSTPALLMRVGEVAAMTGLTTSSIRRLCQQGMLPTAPRPTERSQYRIPRSAVEQLFKLS